MADVDKVLIAILVSFFAILFTLTWLPTFIKVKSAGGKIGIGTILRTKMMRIPMGNISTPLARAAKQGVYLSAKELLTAYVMLGSLDRITDAAILTKVSGYEIPFKYLLQVSFAGADPIKFAEHLKSTALPSGKDINEVVKEFIASQDKEELAMNRISKRAFNR